MKIFIDQGHNPKGFDLGAAYNGLKEQDVTFTIGKLLADRLRRMGIEVKCARESETDVVGYGVNSSLKERANMANAFNADLFLSIHCNAFSASSANGTESYVYSVGSKAYPLAEKITKAICEKLHTKNRGVKTADFVVLKQTKMPAILIETAFISNTSDAEKLRNTEAFALAIFKAIKNHYGLEEKPMNEPEKAKYYIEGTTHIVEIDPRNIFAVETQTNTNKTPYNNFVNSLFFYPGRPAAPNGICVNAGKVLANNATHGKPVSTLIVKGADKVEMKRITDITKEDSVWFAVSGYGIYPKITATDEGFIGKFSDVTRTANRPILGYRKKDNKIVLAVRANSNAERAYQTAKNLGLDFAISLDAGGSTTLKVNGAYKFTGDGRNLWGGIIWS